MDILIFMALAVFLGIRLWTVLGKRPDNGPDWRRKKSGKVVYLHEDEVKIQRSNENSKPLFYPGFNESAFLEGVEKAFFAIVRAYYEGQFDALKKLLTPDFFSQISSPTFSLPPPPLKLLTTTIQSKILEQDTAKISVLFSFEKTTHKKKYTDEMVWSFQRNITSSNPNWSLYHISP